MLRATRKTTTDDCIVGLEGRLDGGTYKITQGGSSSYLSVKLTDNAELSINPDAIIAKTQNIVYKRIFRFKFEKFLSDESFSETVCTGTGEMIFAPPMWGDIIALHVDDQKAWTTSRNFLAMTQNVVKELRSQPVYRNMLKHETTFVYRFVGLGVVFVSSLGAMQKRVLEENEEWVANCFSLVAWNCQYTLASGPEQSSIFCHFKGPGTVITQAQNSAALFDSFAYAGVFNKETDKRTD